MELAVEKREKFGKATKGLRRKGMIPAELYGRGAENLHLSVNAKDFQKVFKEAGESTIVTLVIDSEKRPILIHDVEKNYLTGEVSHVDFYQVRMDEKITLRVPIEFIGEAPAVKEKGGFLNKTLAEVEIEAAAADLPHSLPLRLESLDDLNKSLYVRDLAVPLGVKILLKPETVIVTVMPPIAEEEKKVEEKVDVAAVKVEGEEKRAEKQAAQAQKEEKTGQKAEKAGTAEK